MRTALPGIIFLLFSYILHGQTSGVGSSLTSSQKPNEVDCLNSPDKLSVDYISISPANCVDETGKVAISLNGGIEPYLFTINNNALQRESEFAQLAPGTYRLHIEDAAGCALDTSVTVLKTPCPVYIPNIFSPNGDGVNDLFQIRAGDDENVNITRFFIFDSWGNNVYKMFNLPANSTEGWWDGTYKHFTSNPGVFSYYIEVEFHNGQRETYKGNVTLIR